MAAVVSLQSVPPATVTTRGWWRGERPCPPRRVRSAITRPACLRHYLHSAHPPPHTSNNNRPHSATAQVRIHFAFPQGSTEILNYYIHVQPHTLCCKDFYHCLTMSTQYRVVAATVTLAPMQHPPMPTSSGDNNAPHKYGQQPGGDTLTDFVTLVCQEATNAPGVGCGTVRLTWLHLLVNRLVSRHKPFTTTIMCGQYMHSNREVFSSTCIIISII